MPGTWQTTVTGLLLLAAMVAGRLMQRGAGERPRPARPSRDEFAGMTRRRRPADAERDRRSPRSLLASSSSSINPRFATWPNLVALVEQNAALAIVAVGAMLGIVSRSVDISPGSVIALGAVVAALAFQAGVPVPSSRLLAGHRRLPRGLCAERR